VSRSCDPPDQIVLNPDPTRRYYNGIYIAPDDLKSQFFSLVGEMGWWIGFTMDFVLLMSTIAHTGSADTFCCVFVPITRSP
jgi:hypothetical protein